MTKRILDGKTSKSLLQLIMAEELSSFYGPLPISHQELRCLRELYKEVKEKILTTAIDLETMPKNFIFYEMIKSKIPSFSWTISKDKFSNKNQVVFNAPKVNGKEVSLFTLLSNDFFINELDQNLLNEYLPSEVINDLIILLDEMDTILPDTKILKEIAKWIALGLAGQELTVFSLTCPDYSFEKIDNGTISYRYTFKSLGNAIGPIGRRVISISEKISIFFEKYNIKHQRVIAMADYEILSKSTRTIVQLTYDQFMEKLNSSLKSMCNEVGESTHCLMFTELCNGFEEWVKLLTKNRNAFMKHEFGSLLITEKLLAKILQDRKSVYDRWFGYKDIATEHMNNLLAQAAEYATVGEVLAGKYKNLLIVGADHPTLSLFYSIKRSIPTIYLKRYYV